MSDIFKADWDSRLDPEIENKFLEIKDRLDLTEKKIKDDNLTNEKSIIRDIANDYRLLAEELKHDLYATREKVISHKSYEEFFSLCEELPSIAELRKSNNLPIAYTSFASDFALKDIMNHKYWSHAMSIASTEIQEQRGGHILSYLEQSIILRIRSICQTKEERYKWQSKEGRRKFLSSFIDEDEKATFDPSRIASKILKYPQSLRRKFDSKYKKSKEPQNNIRVTIKALKLELVDAYIIDCFKKYILQRERKNYLYFKNEFIADPISMNESDHKQDNFKLVLYQTETNIFKAPTGSTDPFECKQVKVADVLTYKTDLAKKYRHLLLAPVVDCYGNKTYITFGSDKTLYLISRSKDNIKSNWQAYYEDNYWIQSSSNLKNLRLWERQVRINKKPNS